MYFLVTRNYVDHRSSWISILECDIFSECNIKCGDCITSTKFYYKYIDSYQEDELLNKWLSNSIHYISNYNPIIM